ncbi:hypothetical protein Dsin_033096 [Dipteronia sinensis]|uniref:Peptidase C1A papain C-terminal domain-containing protein n=1 Tax=Dipteronia sinensis TaxID=43782 RepID=A0AAD9Z9C8_9ROSI|nr:hypothetical protein Dsin_033096 [Dipteronia sinensis]
MGCLPSYSPLAPLATLDEGPNRLGCCCSFSDVAAIERALEIKNDNAFQYIIKNKAVTAESSYPYEGSDGTCNQQKATDTAAQITSYKDVTSNNEHELKIAVH